MTRRRRGLNVRPDAGVRTEPLAAVELSAEHGGQATLENKAPQAHRKRRRQRSPTLRNALVLPDQPEEWELELLLHPLLAAYKECVADGASINAA